MARPMFGVESEYAVAGIRGKRVLDREDLVGQYVRAAHTTLVHLPDTCSPSGMFLENGARFYVDCGLHPEMTTPECTNPFELMRYIKAGERVLEGLTRQVQAGIGEGAEIMCFRCNVDYSGSGSTWGCHESYLHRANPGSLPDQLIPHLVTRVIYTGAGGFNPLTNALEFCVAPRLMHIQQVISGESTGNRGIFHTKNESLSRRGNNRLHILCGESLCSETAIVLKIGATALVVAMAEEGLKPGAGLQLASPLEALHAVSTDTTCKLKLRLAAGGEKTALEIQRGLLQLAERNRGVLPLWASGVCALWRRTLGQLEGAPDSVSTVLDWAIKRRLFEDRARRSGVPWERLAFLNSIVKRLNAALKVAGVDDRGVHLAVLLGPKSPIPGEVSCLGTVLTGEGLAWEDVARFLALRDGFYQVDTRFGQLGPRGIFAELDRCGVLNHKIAAVDDPVDSPADSRADRPADSRADSRVDSPADSRADSRVDSPADSGADSRVDSPADSRADGPVDRPANDPVEDRCGTLNHKIAAADGPVDRPVDSHAVDSPVDSIDEAMRRPPPVGRAKLRGEAVRRLSGRTGAACDWMSVRDTDGRKLDLSDPFASAEVWTGPPGAAPDAADDVPVEMLDEFGDPGRFQQMLDAIRGRHGRTRGRAQSPPETTEGSNR